jgi:archaellin
MNHSRITLAITAIVAAAALATVAFAVPQQVMAGGHHNHNNNSNGIKVDQQINQLNNCTDSECINAAQNQADIHR